MPTRATITSILSILLLVAAPAIAQNASKTADHPQDEYPEGYEHVAAVDELLDRAELSITASYDGVASPDFWLLSTQLSQYWEPSINSGAGDWMNESLVSYTRTDSGRDIELKIEIWDPGTGMFVPDFLRATTRNENGQATETLDQQWEPTANGGAGGYVPLQRRSSEYTPSGQTSMSTTELWDEDAGDYFIWNRTSYEYDGEDRISVRLFESALFGPLAPSLRYNYTYNGDGLTESIRRESHNGNDFENSGLNEYTYDSNGEEIEDLESDWDEDGGDWVRESRTTTEFSPNSLNPTLEIETDQNWDTDAGDWLNDEREITELTAADEITLTFQEWDPNAAGKQQGAWINTDQSITTLTQEGPKQSVTQIWDIGLGAWVDDSRDTQEYNEQGNIETSLSESWDGTNWLNEFLLTQTYEEFQSPTAVDTDEISGGFALKSGYPNPFRQSTTISFTLPGTEQVTLEVFDMLGRHIETLVDGQMSAGTHDVRMDARDLPAGLYMYRLSGQRVDLSKTVLLVR